VLADSGYLTEKSLEAMERRGQKCLIAVGREGKKPKWPGKPLSQKMHRMLRLPWAQDLYAHRKTQGERPFAVIKGPMGFQRFMLRTKRKARGEWDLVASALLDPRPDPRQVRPDRNPRRDLPAQTGSRLHERVSGQAPR
jgi:hypothetical protein